MPSYRFAIGDEVFYEGKRYVIKERFCSNSLSVNEYRLEGKHDASDMYAYEHRLTDVTQGQAELEESLYGHFGGNYNLNPRCECSARSDRRNSNLHDTFCPLWEEMFKGNKIEIKDLEKEEYDPVAQSEMLLECLGSVANIKINAPSGLGNNQDNQDNHRNGD